MIVADSIIYGDKEFLLGFDQIEHPLALQLAGSDPLVLSQAALIGESYGYDEINLNIGCPSKRVQAGNFGACLMADPKLVAECVEKIKEKVSIPVTIKCRIAIDDYNPDEMLTEFVEVTKNSGVSTFIIHARKAMLEGLDPKQNREIPPLDYDIVRMIKRKWPELNIVLNGGLLNLYEAKKEISKSKGIKLDGVMLGRAVQENPYSIIEVDKLFFNDNRKLPSRIEIVEEMISYLELCVKNDVPINIVTQNMLGLFHGRRGAKLWRSYLSHEAPRRRNDPNVLKEALDEIISFQSQAA
tara:strand:- start:4385 stop:5278 length:894 start_codon:yes stop_codon:yes gene_type:complete